MKKQKPVSRKKAPPFKRALAAAKKELAAKLEERESVRVRLMKLNGDIPNLERTCRALEAQLQGGGMVDAAPRLDTRSGGGGDSGSSHVRSARANGEALSPTGGSNPSPATSDYPIPPEVLAKLPPDYQKPVTGEEDEFLPKIEGKPILPEK